MTPALQDAEVLISVIVVNWNGGRFLPPCLEALRRQTFSRIEVILVDNGSTDSSIELVHRDFPEVRVLALGTNQGFSSANNAGIREAQGRFIALLNNDAEPEPNWLADLVGALDSRQDIGFCASKMVLFDTPSVVDSCGDFYSVEGVPGKLGHRGSADHYSQPREVFGACGGAGIYRRALLEEVRGFDEDFFLVYEDSDLSFRARLLGYRCMFVPTAVVRHRLGATLGRESTTAVYHAQRNMEFVYFKCMPTRLLVKYFPLHILADTLLFLRHVLRRQGWVFVKAKRDALRMMPKMLRKRREIQDARRVKDAEIDRALERGYLSGRIKRWLGRDAQTAQPAL